MKQLVIDANLEIKVIIAATQGKESRKLAKTAITFLDEGEAAHF